MSETLRELIRECIHAELLEARTFMGIDMTDLSLGEQEEVELYMSGNISLDDIESPVVKRRITGMQARNQRSQPGIFRQKDPNKETVVKRREGNQPNVIPTPNRAKPPPPTNRLINGQTMGKREHSVDLGMMNITNDFGDKLRIRHRERQQAPGYWIWDTSKRDSQGKIGDWVWVPGKTYGK